MFKAVLFDMDGVIIDSEPIHYRLSKKYHAELGLAVSDEEYNTFVGLGDLAIYTRLKEKYGLKQSVAELVDTYQERYLNDFKNLEGEKPIKGIEPLICELHRRNIRLALGSSANRKNVEAVLEYFNFWKYFHAVVSGSEVERAKPFPDIYLKAAKKLDVDSSDCIVIEDSTNGIKAAKLAGMTCIAYRNPNSGDQDLSQADSVIESFEELNLDQLFRS